jgi:hypothetical protein
VRKKVDYNIKEEECKKAEEKNVEY